MLHSMSKIISIVSKYSFNSDKISTILSAGVLIFELVFIFLNDYTFFKDEKKERKKIFKL